MNRWLFLAIATCMLVLSACSKNRFSAQYKYDVSDSIETKAFLGSPMESGINIIWEDGDLIAFKVEIYRDIVTAKMMITKIVERVEGKLVYENGSWITYRANGSSFSKVDHISISSPTLNCKVGMRFSCTIIDRENGDSNHIVWDSIRPFSEGLQSILVTPPFGNRK